MSHPRLTVTTHTSASSGSNALKISPRDWVAYLPRLSLTQAQGLDVLGITAISAIPANFPLSPKQRIIRNATSTGQPYVAADLAERLRGLGPPALYLDFEAIMPAIPLFEGTRPFQTLPFQWSLHGVHADGTVCHREFLACGTRDPRREFAETLIAALAEGSTPVVVYSLYEQTQLKELATQFPDLSGRLQAVMARLVDLLPIVRGGLYLPDFQFSNSIKRVAPALSPGFGYEDLKGVAEGAAAAGEFLRLASGQVQGPGEIERLRAALLAYCQRDTLAMVEVHRALIALTS